MITLEIKFMSKPNLNSSWGQITGSFPVDSVTGKVFMVADTTVTDDDLLEDLWIPDFEGIKRFHTTVDAAIGQTEASRGDVIYVHSDHAENIADATTFQIDKAGVQVIGLGRGNNRPTFTFTNTAGSVEMDSANTRISNIIFKSSITAVVVGVNMDANGCELDNCEFQYDETGDDFITMVDIDGIDYCTVQGCRFIAEETAGCSEAIRIDDAHFTRILNNFFTGDFTDAIIVGEGALSNGIEISGNSGYNSDTTAGITIDLNVACTGVVENNHFGSAADVDPNTTFDPGSCATNNNTVSLAPDSAAVTVPYGGDGGWNVARKVSSAFDGGTGNAHGDQSGSGNPYSLFTVSGDCMILAVVGVVNTALTGNATLEVGTAGNTAKLIAQTDNTGGTLAAGDIWIDGGAESGVDIVSAAGPFFITGTDIVETVGSDDFTAGQIDYYCIWKPLEAGASIIAA